MSRYLRFACSQASPLTTPWRTGTAAGTVSFKWLVAHLEWRSCVPGGRVRCFGPQSSLRVWSPPEPHQLKAQHRTGAVMLPWGPEPTPVVSMGFAFQHVDIVLNGDTIFYLSGFFQLIHCVCTGYKQQQNKNPDLFPCTVIPVQLWDWVSLERKKPKPEKPRLWASN